MRLRNLKNLSSVAAHICTYLLFTSTLLSLQVFERLVVCWCLDLDFGVLSKGRGDGGVMRAWPLCDGGAAGIL